MLSNCDGDARNPSPNPDRRESIRFVPCLPVMPPASLAVCTRSARPVAVPGDAQASVLPAPTPTLCRKATRGRAPRRPAIVASASSAASETKSRRGGGPEPYLKCINRFRDEWVLMKGDKELQTDFRGMNNFLLEDTAEAVRPSEVMSLVEEEGYTLVDVRINWSHQEWHLEQAVHVPLQRIIEGNGPDKVWRKFGHALFVEFPAIESNYPNWLETMQRDFTPEDKLIISCDMGGLLSDDPSKAVMSSSFEALYFLKNCGFKNLKYVQGGFCGWRSNEALLALTPGIRDNMPWFKTMQGVKEFFPSPCNWQHVRRCACQEDSEGGK